MWCHGDQRGSGWCQKDNSSTNSTGPAPASYVESFQQIAKQHFVLRGRGCLGGWKKTLTMQRHGDWHGE
jgi:hypothetical protein